MSDKVKSANIAISELKLDAMISASGLTKVTTVDGFWKDKVKDKGKVEYQDILVLSLSSSAPDGMTLDPATGIVEWKIPKGLTGSYPIDIMVSDGCGGRCSQSFNIYIGES